jgi:photosystem II stability/assembly factor-like uncharacterized protein
MKKLPYFRWNSIVLLLVIVIGALSATSSTVDALFSNRDTPSVVKSDFEILHSNDAPPQPLDMEATADTVTLSAWRNLRPTESYLRDVSMLPNPDEINCSSIDQKSKGWIVGESGLILSYCNGIWDHALTTESIPTTLYGVAAVTPTLGFAVGVNGTILKYGWDDVAQNYLWIKLPITISNKILYRITVIPTGNGNYTAWVMGEKDSTNKGTIIRGSITKSGQNDPNGHPKYNSTWTNMTASYPQLPNTDLYFGLSALSSTDIWAVGGNYTTGSGGAIHWNGSTWGYQSVGNQVLYGVYFVSTNEGWAGGEGGYIYHYNGSNWSIHSRPIQNVIVDISFDENGTGWAIGFDGTILKYIRDVDEWILFDDLRTDHFDFYALDHTSGHGWLVGMNPDKQIGGQILEYADDLWLAVTPPTDNQLNEISVISDNNAWAVGVADSYGPTIIHWDGKHWQRWYQDDPPLEKTDLQTIKMISENNGWAVGNPLTPDGPAVFLHWNGRRWEPSRYLAPLNAQTNDIDLVTLEPMTNPHDFGWAVASTGNAVAKYDFSQGYWSANHTCNGFYYDLRGTSIVSDGSSNWDAWSVGTRLTSPNTQNILRFQDGCAGGLAWDNFQEMPLNSKLFGINMSGYGITLDGFTVGNLDDQAVIYRFINDEIDANDLWQQVYLQPPSTNPSRFYAVDLIEKTGIAWVGGYYTSGALGKVAFLAYYDINGFGWAGYPLPLNGVNIRHRPISSVDFSSDTMGWAIGEKEDTRKISVIYQYPFPNFTLSVSPQTQTIRPGNQAGFNVSINTLGITDLSSDLNLINLPDTMSASISSNPMNSGETAALTITTADDTPTGEYFIWLSGTSTFTSGDEQITATRYEYIRLIIADTSIYSVDPNHGPSGTIVTIHGENFGADPGSGNRSTSSHYVILAGRQMPDENVVSWDDDAITVLVPDHPTLFEKGPDSGIVMVLADSSASNQNLSFQLENRITDANINEIGSSYEITIYGTSFGNDPGFLNRSTIFENVHFNGNQLATENVIYWDNNTIVFQTNSIEEINSVMITSNGFQSNTFVFGLSSNNIYLPLLLK